MRTSRNPTRQTESGAHSICVSLAGLLSLCLLLGLTRSTSASEARAFVPGKILFKSKPQAADSELVTRLHRNGSVRGRISRHSNIRLLEVNEREAESLLAALRLDPNIEFAERDYVAQASFLPNDPYFQGGNQWHLAKIQAPQAWDLAAGDPQVIVAVLDSGVNAAHPDLSGRILPGFDFVWNDNDPSDDFGHGTAVAGTIVANANNELGVAGVAFGCSVLPVKVMDASGSAAHSTIAQGIEYAVAHGARIINLSLGGDWPSSTLQDAIDYAWSNNVIVIASAGNNGGTIAQYPAACEHVLGVAASTAEDSRAWFSSYGSFVTLYAPGANIWTTQRDLSNPYGSWCGTSFASPIVAGVAALLVSADPLLSNSQVVDVLKQTADDLGEPGYDEIFSYGRVNAFRALTAVATLPPVVAPAQAPVVSLSNPLNAAEFSLGAPLQLSANASAGTGAVSTVSFLANGTPVGFSPTTPFTTSWTPSAAGTYTLLAVALDEQGNRGTSAPVTIRVSQPPGSVMTAPLTVRINGTGSVVPNLDGTQLELGKTYRIRAVAGPGQIFAGWTGVTFASPTLTFTMQSNLTLVANFVPNPFPGVRGSYAGLVANSHGVTPDSSGYFALTVTSAGMFTGKLMLAGSRHSFRGQLDLAGNATVSVRRDPRPPLRLAVHIDLTNHSDETFGSLTDGRWTATLAGDRNTFSSRSNPASQAGSRSFLLEHAENNDAAATGLSRISSSGSTSIRGKLRDGRPFAAPGALAKNGDCPFYLSLNRGSEVVIGWLNFPAGTQPTATGTVLWVKAGTNAFASTLQATSFPAQ